ncbi:response regulator transcription factor [Aquibacillus rhizosphaerae]|uniref:Response regulator transcription factor n=1 Tax=Aquibacillus rhizosphaerae TaxID=3051431 RepID=A0ABT7L5C5_9BACI|nr:response regulator transcription factor [Aquibacillus sp. LR5S19]MDL4841065.1 response regulator transcription factor [Aquibacillus sp. LR5S19]
MKNKIFVVEDDPNIRDIVVAYLKKEGYEVQMADNAEDAWEMTNKEQPDMWVLDIMLPGMDGYELCKKIRQISEVPIIIISAKDDEVDKILGLELGSDDYLTKPFSPRELVARVKRIFKRVDVSSNSVTDTSHEVKLGDLTINTDDRRVFWEGKEVEVTAKEFDMLNILIRNQNRAFARDELLELIWGEDYFGSDRAVDDLIKRLRKKLDGLPVETVWGYGYRMRSHLEENQ